MIILLMLVLMSCSQGNEVSRQPFEINQEVTCADLVEAGYRWMPEDVPLLGKRVGDTLVYFQLTELTPINWPLATKDDKEVIERTVYYDSTYDEYSRNAHLDDCKGLELSHRYYSLRIAKKDSNLYPSNILMLLLTRFILIT